MPAVLLRPTTAPSAAPLLSALRSGLGEVAAAADPREALALLRAEPRAVLVLDLREADPAFAAAAGTLGSSLSGVRSLALLRPGDHPPVDCEATLTTPLYLREVVRWCARASAAPPARGMLADFAAGLSHEIGNPLTALQLQLELLRGGDLSEETRETLATLEEAGRRIQQVVDDVAGASESAPVAPRPTRLRRLVEAAREALGARVADGSRRLRLECDDAPLLADAPLLSGALADLWQYLLLAGDEGGSLTVSAGARDGATLSIRARARVPRLPSDAGPRLFTPLWARQALGLPAGLSLTAARAAFVRHGGELLARGQRGGELTIEALLPRGAPA